MAHRYRFADLTIDPESFRLLRADKALAVEPKALNLLIFLVENRGRLVERRELLSAVWGDAFVTDHVLNRAIGQLRKVLADDAKEPRYIETVPTLGYRFIAEVAIETTASALSSGPGSSVLASPAITPATTPASDRASAPTSNLTASTAPAMTVAAQPLPAVSAQLEEQAVAGMPSPGGQRSSPRRPPSRTAVATAVVLLLLLGCASAWLAFRRFGPSSHGGIRSLAVIPLTNVSGDPAQDYLADGMSDQLITNLGQISALRVISQTTAAQYKNAHKPLPQIAQELHVDAVVEGSVSRSGDQVRIVAQLINAVTEKQLWSHTYEGDLRNVLGLENQVASAVAERIRVKLTQPEQTQLADRQDVDPQAYEALLKGNYFFEQNSEATTRKSLQYFQRAVQLDPGFARAYVGIARSYNFLGDGIVPAGEATAAADAAIAHALQLQPDLAAAYAERGWTLLFYHWDFPGVERDFRRALELDPGLADAHAGYGNYLALMGRFAEGLQEMKRARDLAPLSPLVVTDYCNLLLQTRHYREAQTQCAAALELDPNYQWALALMVEVNFATKDYPQAHAAMARMLASNGEAEDPVFDLYKDLHENPLRGAIAFQAYMATHKDLDPFIAATAYALSGRKEEALAWLEKAYARRIDLHDMTFLSLAPNFDSLRSDPRFDDFLRHAGLPPQPRAEFSRLQVTGATVAGQP